MRAASKLWVGFNASTTAGLSYYGYRFYEPQIQRWISRDPIAERGGGNLYVICGNEMLISFDKYGLSSSTPSLPLCGQDVSVALQLTLSNIETEFNAASLRVRTKACEVVEPRLRNVMSADSWDIGWLQGFRPSVASGARSACSIGCEDTVALNGQCHSTGNVNHVMYGHMSRLCGFGLEEAMISMRDMLELRATVGNANDRWNDFWTGSSSYYDSSETIETKLSFGRYGYSGLNGTPPQASSSCFTSGDVARPWLLRSPNRPVGYVNINDWHWQFLHERR
jgi:RHS repeat-associated protein